jgi:uncharacterized protein YecT (DUF1311 family)
MGTGLFYLFNWLYSQRFQAQSEVIALQTQRAELREGIDVRKQQLNSWEGGQQGANWVSADLASLHDALLDELYTRLHKLVPAGQRVQLETQQKEWLALRSSRAHAAALSEGGSLGPLIYNIEFTEATKKRIAALQAELKASEAPRPRQSRKRLAGRSRIIL